jgi:conjugal transfer ATP-binding protein TraC
VSLLNSLLELFGGSADRVTTEGDVTQLASRVPFSQYLCYEAYDPERKEYLNAGGTFGYLWECRPLAFLTDKALESLAGLLRQEYPERTTIQFTLFPDDGVDGKLSAYLKLKVRADEVVQKGATRYAEHLRQGRKGLPAMAGIPVRNFRLLVAIKSPEAFRDDRIKSIEEFLGQAGLAPSHMGPAGFLDVMRRVLNSDAPQNTDAYDDNVPIRKQIIQAETAIRVQGEHLKLGSRFAACLSPKSMPASGVLDRLAINCLIGGYSGPQEDGTQLTQKFWWTTTVFFNTKPADIRRKASFMAAQRIGGSLAKDLARRNVEMSQVLDQLEHDKFVDVISSVWVFADSEEEMHKAVARTRGLWEQQRFVMQRESHIGLAMLIVSLPFGLHLVKGNVVTLDRHFTMSAKAAAHLFPVQADFGGRMRPVQLYVGRKGQIVEIDVFDKRANNHNFLVCANSGAGKSFMMNKLVDDYYGAGAKVRIIDIGYSYQKQTMLKRGRYVDVGQERGRLCLNPFTTSAVGKEADEDELTVASVLLTMAFSATQVPQDENTYYTLMKDAVRFARNRDNGLKGVDHVEEYLREFPRHAGDRFFDGAKPLAHKMAFNLRDFTSQGKYGQLFNGKSTLDISSDDFVVLELEQILTDVELFQVIAMQVINAITQDLYLSDRSHQRFMVFDEAWKYFSATPMIANIIKEGYRRARKYGGATGIITQSPLDLRAFGDAGVVIKSNSAFKFFLESTDYEQAVQAGILDYQGLLKDLAKSVRNTPPRYSEILFDTPFGAGVARLCADRFTYWMNTTTASEVAAFMHQMKISASPTAAIEALIAAENARAAGRAA